MRTAITAQRGLGPWTAEWFLARHLARPRAWPTGDLALRKAALNLYGVDVHELGPRLDPFQNLSAHYLLTGWLTPAVTVRPATEADETILRELWEEFEQEVPEPPGFEPETWAEEWGDTTPADRVGRRVPRESTRTARSGSSRWMGRSTARCTSASSTCGRVRAGRG